MKNILLINPPLSFVYGFKRKISSILPPLGLLSIYSYLRKKKHTVQFYDLEFEKDSELLYKNIRNASIVGITLTTPSFLHASEIAKRIKKINPNCLIIGGGWHVTLDTWKTILNYDFDMLIFGEGEIVFNDIINYYKESPALTIEYFINQAPKEIKKGIAFKYNNHKQLYPGTNYLPNIDELPFPAYDIIDWDRYKLSAHRDLGAPYLPIITARGCPYSCTYCANTGKWRHYSASYIRNIIIEMQKHFNNNIRNLVFWDDTFTLPIDRVNILLDHLKEFKLNFSINTHPSSVNEDILIKLKKAGCKIIFYGIESNNKRILKGLGRTTTIEEMKQTIQLTRKAGILSLGSVMIGTPFDNLSSIESHVKFLKYDINPDLCFFSSFSLEPGTKLYKQLIENENFPPYSDWYELFSKDSDFIKTPPPYVPSSNKILNKKVIDEKVKWAYNIFYDKEKIEDLESKIIDFPFLKNIINRINSRND